MRNPNDPNRAIVSILLLVSVACERGDTVACPPLVDGVPVLTASGEGEWRRHGQSRVLEEVWRRGGTNSGEELSLPMSVAVSPSGDIAIPDFALQELIVVDADGTWLGSWSRQGRGPGEMTRPVAAAWIASDTLLAFDIEQHKLARLHGAGAAGEDVAVNASFTGPSVLRGSFIGMHLQPNGSALLLTDLPIDASRVRDAVVRLDAATGAIDTLAAPVSRLVVEGWAEARVPGWPRAVAHVGSAGHFAVAAEDGSYRVMVYGPDGRPRHQICRMVEPFPVDDRELPNDSGPQAARLIAALDAAPKPAVPAAIGRLLVTGDGGVWLQRHRRSHADPTGFLHGVAGTPWDVFDAEGRYLGEIAMPDGVRPQAVMGDDLWAFVIGPLDETWVVRYRMDLEG